MLLTDWEAAHSGQGPVLQDEDWSHLLRQSMTLDLEELMAEAEPVVRLRQSPPSESNSVAGVVDKVDLLTELQEEIEAAEVVSEEVLAVSSLSVAYDENVSQWVGAIARWFAQHPRPIRLLELQQHLGLSLVEVWLGLLLSERVREMHQTGGFYENDTLLIQGS